MKKENIWKVVLDNAEEEIHMVTKEEDEMTVTEFAEISGMSRKRARRFLDDKVKKGELELRVLPIGSGIRVYKPTHA